MHLCTYEIEKRKRERERERKREREKSRAMWVKEPVNAAKTEF